MTALALHWPLLVALAAGGIAWALARVARTDEPTDRGGWNPKDLEYRQMLARIEESQSERTGGRR